MADDSGVLAAPLIIEYPFSRTTGPVIGAFLTGLREQVLLGIKGTDGRVLVPPTEYDPLTGEDLTELVEVGPGRHRAHLGLGPRAAAEAAARPTRSPGRSCSPTAPTSASSRPSTPARPRRCPPACGCEPRWADEREGSIHDLACWEPEA